MPYLVLKDLIFSRVSTKLANLHILRRLNTKEKLKEKTLMTKDRRRCKKLTELGAQLLGNFFFGFKRLL